MTTLLRVVCARGGHLPAVRHAAHNLAMGVPPPPCLGRCAHCQWYRLGRPWRRYALLRWERLEDVRVDDGVPGPGGGAVLVRLLGAGHRPLRISPNLSLCVSHWPVGC